MRTRTDRIIEEVEEGRMSWKVLEKMNLPVYDENQTVVDGVLKVPGDTITKQEMKDARQSDESIADLVKYKAIEEA